ncbi:MAG: four helix bundle protein [Oscillospiraceae bacterium]|nr:four helix bundle protein [Oscillospiraceae bacterium]
MKKDITNRAFEFSVRIVNLARFLKAEKKEFALAEQVLKSGTSICANLTEAEYAQSKLDFIHKNSIALKECAETEYWLKLFAHTNLISQKEYESLNNDCKEIIKILIVIIKNSKTKRNS